MNEQESVILLCNDIQDKNLKQFALESIQNKKCTNISSFITIPASEFVFLYDGTIQQASELKEGDLLFQTDSESCTIQQIYHEKCKLTQFYCHSSSEDIFIRYPDTMIVMQNNKTKKGIQALGLKAFPIDPYLFSYATSTASIYDDENLFIDVRSTTIRDYIENYINQSNSELFYIEKQSFSTYSFYVDDSFYSYVDSLLQYRKTDLVQFLGGIIDGLGSVNEHTVTMCFDHSNNLFLSTVKCICSFLNISYTCRTVSTLFSLCNVETERILITIQLHDVLKYISTQLHPNSNVDELPSAIEYTIEPTDHQEEMDCVCIKVDGPIMLSSGFSVQPILLSLQHYLEREKLKID